MTANTRLESAPFEEVERLFFEQVRHERLHPGAALAIYRHGQLVLDLVDGFADTQTGQRAEPDTMFVLFSSTKPLASVALLQQVERGAVELDAPLARYWPAFGQNGKEKVTARHILTHRGGFPETPPGFSTQRWGDWDEAVRQMEGCVPKYEPGTTNAYHAFNHGWVCAEVIRRVDGRDFPRYLREELTGPLTMDDTYVGLPAALNGRVAKVHATEDTDDPWILRMVNRPGALQYVQPAAIGVSTARDMGRFYAALLNHGELEGARILKPETVEMATAVEVNAEMDVSLGVTMRRGLGFNLGGMDGPNLRFGRSSSERTFGHGGAGTSICWADKDLDLAMVFIPNGFRNEETNTARARALSDAVRSACGG